MEFPRGRILSIQNDASPRRATIEVAAPLHCARCAAGKGCGAGLVDGGDEPRRVEALLASNLDCREGDEVWLELPPDRLLLAAWLAYGLPLTGAIAGAAIAWLTGAGDPEVAMAALGGAALGISAARWQMRRSGCALGLTPTVTARCVAD